MRNELQQIKNHLYNMLSPQTDIKMLQSAHIEATKVPNVTMIQSLQFVNVEVTSALKVIDDLMAVPEKIKYDVDELIQDLVSAAYDNRVPHRVLVKKVKDAYIDEAYRQNPNQATAARSIGVDRHTMRGQN